MQGPSTGKLNKAVRRKPAECTHDVLTRVVPPDEIADICRQLGYAYRKRLFTPVVTMAAMLLQALSKDKSQKNAVVQTMTQRLACGLPAGSHDPSSLCAARQRLPLELLKRVTRLAANRQRQQAGGDAAWWGRRVVLADGSSCSMLDTPENQAFFGQPSGQKPGCGFPVASLCALFNLSTGVVFDLAVGPYVASEHDLWHQLWPSLKEGDLAVADRLYGTYAEILLLRQRGVDCAFRVQQTRKLPPGGWTDRVVTWQKGPRPKWMSPEQYAALPDTQQVRLVRFRIKEPGVRTCCVTLVSTLLNRKRYLRKKLAALYGRRWNVETNLNHLKTSLGMNVLAAEKPETVIKEIWAHALAYNLVRTVMWEAGRRHGVDPLRLSLSDAVKEIRSHRCFALLGSARRWIARLLRKVASHRIPHRPGRHEPRVRKRRPKEYPLMTQPRPVLRRQIMQAS